MDIAKVALELYTVRDETARDFAGTIRQVAAIGYPGVEFAGYGNLSAEEMKALLTETGLRAFATHVRLQAIEQNLAQEIAYCQKIACPLLILPWLPPELHTVEGFRQLASRMNTFGQQCRDQGITFGYHNHDFEFAQHDGETLMSILLANTDPALVKIELDVYWATYAGVDPIALLRQNPGRIPIIHLKDMTPERTFTEVGAGTMPMADIIQAALASGTQVFAVENDAPTIPSLESARRSLENLRAMA